MAKHKRGNYIFLLVISIMLGLVLTYFSGRFIGDNYFSDESMVFGLICSGIVLCFASLVYLPDFFYLRNNVPLRKTDRKTTALLELLFVILAAGGVTCLLGFLLSGTKEWNDYFSNSHLVVSLFYGNDFDFWNYGDMTHGIYYSFIRGLFFLLGNHSDIVLFTNIALFVLMITVSYYLFSRVSNRLSGALLAVLFLASFERYREVIKDGTVSLRLILFMSLLLMEVCLNRRRLLDRRECRLEIVESIVTGLVFGGLLWVDMLYVPAFLVCLLLNGYMTYPGNYKVKYVFFNGLIKTATALLVSALCIFLVNPADYKVIGDLSFDVDVLKDFYESRIFVDAMEAGHCLVILLLALAGCIVMRLGSYFGVLRKEKIEKARLEKASESEEDSLTFLTLEETKPVTEETPVAEPEAPVAEPEAPAAEPEVPVKVELIPNPLKGPKKHEKRDFEYKYEVDEDRMNFDFEVPESLNHFDY